MQVLDGVDPLADRQARREAPTVNDLLDRYLAEHVAKKNKRTTRASVEQLVARFIRPALGGHKIAAITRDDLARLHGAMSDTPRQANFALAVCSKAFNLAERWGWRSVGAGNPCRLIERYDEAERDRFLSVEALGHLGAALRVAESEGLPWKLGPARPTSKHLPRSERQRTRVAGVIIAAIELLLFTGLRRGEALELVRKLQAGLQSFLSMRRIEARRKKASAFRLRFSQSLASFAAIEPGDGALDDPSFGQHRKSAVPI